MKVNWRHTTTITEDLAFIRPVAFELVLKIEKATGIQRSPTRVLAWMKKHGFRF